MAFSGLVQSAKSRAGVRDGFPHCLQGKVALRDVLMVENTHGSLWLHAQILRFQSDENLMVVISNGILVVYSLPNVDIQLQPNA